MEFSYTQLPTTVMVETATLLLLTFIALSPLGMFVWMVNNQERYPHDPIPEPIKHRRHRSHRAHPVH